MKCPECKGSGVEVLIGATFQCENCDGTGKVSVLDPKPPSLELI